MIGFVVQGQKYKLKCVKTKTCELTSENFPSYITISIIINDVHVCDAWLQFH